LAGVGNGQLKRAVSVSFGNDNRVYVTDKDKSVIDIFSIVPHAHPYTVKKTTTETTSTTSTKNAKSGNPSQSKEYTLIINFNDFAQGYKGKTTVTIKNPTTHEVLGKKTFDFGKINDGSFDCCEGEMTFDSKGSKTGDKLTLDAVDTGKNGGSISGYELNFDMQKLKYKLVLV
jgi:hypothetical protein